jgi:phosphoribosylformimino-5-aminoimidazole carboxamide ribotide isomerase
MINNKFILYPAIDIKDGKCVRLLFGDMDKETVYNIDPLDQAMWFVDQGAEWLHIVDLDGAVKGKQVNKISILKILKTLQNKVKIQIGGGIRSKENIDFWLGNLADRVILGTLALENPSFVNNLSQEYFKKVLIGADVRNGMIASHGWEKQSDISAIDLLRKFNQSLVGSVIYTDISKDGSMKGVSLDQTISFAKQNPHPVIASGGVSSLNDILKLYENFSNGIEGVVIGRALYDKKFTFEEALYAIRKGIY